MEDQLEKVAGSSKMRKMLKHKSFIPILVLFALGVALAGGIAVGGYLWHQNQQQVSYSGPCDSRIPFTTFTDSNWGYSISYPETWFIESYGVGDNVAGSVQPENAKPEELPYYMAVLATVDGNFSPQYSEEGEVMSVFLERDPIDPNFSLEDTLQTLRDQGDLGTVDGWPISIDGLLGSIVTMVDESGYTSFVSLDSAPYTYVLNFNVTAGSQQEACLVITDRIKDSFNLTSSR